MPYTYCVNNLVVCRNRHKRDHIKDSTFVRANDEEEAKKLAIEKFDKVYKKILHWRNYTILIVEVKKEGEI